MNTITLTERAMLAAIDSYYDDHGHSPTVMELSRIRGVSFTVARQVIDALELKGLVSREARKRSVRLTSKAMGMLP